MIRYENLNSLVKHFLYILAVNFISWTIKTNIYVQLIYMSKKKNYYDSFNRKSCHIKLIRILTINYYFFILIFTLFHNREHLKKKQPSLIFSFATKL